MIRFYYPQKIKINDHQSNWNFNQIESLFTYNLVKLQKLHLTLKLETEQ